MTHYLLSVHNDDSPVYPTPDDMEQAFTDTGKVNDAMQAAGVWVFANGLQPSTTAKVVRVRDGAIERTDGPYLESKEHIGGFWVVDVADEEAALALAEKATIACLNAVEVRPFQPIPES